MIWRQAGPLGAYSALEEMGHSTVGLALEQFLYNSGNTGIWKLGEREIWQLDGYDTVTKDNIDLIVWE